MMVYIKIFNDKKYLMLVLDSDLSDYDLVLSWLNNHLILINSAFYEIHMINDSCDQQKL